MIPKCMKAKILFIGIFGCLLLIAGVAVFRSFGSKAPSGEAVVILGTPAPPPPPDVPAIEPDIRGATTIKEQLSRHRDIASCASCHRKIDPPGFALENFDVIGGWRDNYRALVEPRPGARAKLSDGPPVDTADEL